MIASAAGEADRPPRADPLAQQSRVDERRRVRDGPVAPPAGDRVVAGVEIDQHAEELHGQRHNNHKPRQPAERQARAAPAPAPPFEPRRDRQDEQRHDEVEIARSPASAAVPLRHARVEGDVLDDQDAGQEGEARVPPRERPPRGQPEQDNRREEEQPFAGADQQPRQGFAPVPFLHRADLAPAIAGLQRRGEADPVVEADQRQRHRQRDRRDGDDARDLARRQVARAPASPEARRPGEPEDRQDDPRAELHADRHPAAEGDPRHPAARRRATPPARAGLVEPPPAVDRAEDQQRRQWISEEGLGPRPGLRPQAVEERRRQRGRVPIAEVPREAVEERADRGGDQGVEEGRRVAGADPGRGVVPRRQRPPEQVGRDGHQRLHRAVARIVPPPRHRDRAQHGAAGAGRDDEAAALDDTRRQPEHRLFVVAVGVAAARQQINPGQDEEQRQRRREELPPRLPRRAARRAARGALSHQRGIRGGGGFSANGSSQGRSNGCAASGRRD